ncbi:MAG: hypothetical protein AB1Z98_13115 [Nannocystaceae bacterium]
MTKIATSLCALMLVTSVACDKKEDKKTDDKAAAKSDAAKPGDAKADDAKAAEPAPEPEAALPKLVETDLADWSIKISLPEGAKLGEAEAGDEDMEMPDSITVDTEDACGYDIDLTRHWAKSLDSMYDNSKKMVDGLTEVEWIKDDKTDKGYTVHYKGKAPLGDMYGMATGTVVGDRLVLCDSGLGRSEKDEAACLLSVCETITVAEAG